MLEVYDVRCDDQINPIGLGDRCPEFGWKMKSDAVNVMQTKYRVQVSNESRFTNILWDSGEVASDQSVHLPYRGPELLSCTRYYFRVKAWDNQGNESEWNTTSFFETGILDPSEWRADFISADRDKNPTYSSASPFFRKTFEARGEVLRARLYATAFGLYEMRLNGKRVGDFYLTPGWTSYNKRLQYQTYDITSLVQDGKNVVGAMLGNGWYKGPVAPWEGNATNKYGTRTALLAELHIFYKDGTEQIILTDDSWKTTYGPILKSEIYDGEIYDATKELGDWDSASYDDSGWSSVTKIAADKKILTAQEDIPVVKQEVLQPVSLIHAPNGDKLLDFGQNMVGWVRFRVSGPKGSRVVLHHAEILDKEGNFYTTNLRTAKQTVMYILKGEGCEVFEPHFTYQGFRYVRIAEYPGEIKLENFEGVVLHSGMEQTGTFSCSETMVNQLQHNILWGQKGNFVDVPTDCPQRDERLGWTGDAQIFARTACFNMDTALFFKKWLRDLAADQLPDGQVGYVVPNVMSKKDYSSSGWGDAAVICPWTVYLCYGDKRVLQEQYPSMKGWVEYIRSQAHNNIWDTGSHFGDWLALDKTSVSHFNGLLGKQDDTNNYLGATPNDFISTAYYAYSTSLLAKAAGVIGQNEDEKEYTRLAQQIKESFQEEYFTPTGRLAVQTQTACVLALMFNLVREKDRKRTVEMLLSLLEDNNWHLTTGFLGTPYLCHVLSENGHPEIACRLLMQTDYPSWLYQITKGATTVWEHWDGMKPDGSFWSPDMNSFNHYAYGSIGSWLYQVLCGIEIDQKYPAYKKIRFCPTLPKEFTWAKASHESLYGTVALEWKRSDGVITVRIQVPVNTSAEVTLPYTDGNNLTINGEECKPDMVSSFGANIKVGSGTWNFRYPMREAQ